MKRKKIKQDMVDVTKDGIDENVKKYLALGPDFSGVPTRVPYERIISKTEKICTVMKKEEEIKEMIEDVTEHEVNEVHENVNKMLEEQDIRGIKRT